MHRGAKTVAVLAALVVLVLATTGLSSAKEEKNALPRGCSTMFTVQDFRPFSADVWRLSAWERGAPPKKVIRAQRERLHCSTPSHRKAMQNTWHADKKRFYERRARELFRVRVTPFYGGGSWWAIPYYVVVCESGGRYNDPSAPNGAYSLLTGPLQGVPTWESWRPDWASGYAAPYEAPARAQDIAAHRLYVSYGLEPWECA